MSLAVEILCFGGIIPAAISIAVMFLFRRFGSERTASRYAAAVGFGTAFFAGYVLLPPWAALYVSRSWHWLPYLGAAAMALGPGALADRVSATVRAVLQLVLAILTAWLLVPTWSDLQPTRPVWIALLAGYLFVLMVLMNSLPDRIPGRRLLGFLSAVAGAAAVMLAVFVSIKFGQLAWISTAALGGCSVAATGGDNREGMARGLIPAFVVIVGGAVFVGCINPQPPLVGLLLVPAAPLALWSCVFGPLARLRGAAAGAAQTAAVLVPLAVAILLAISAEQTGN